MCEGTAGYVLKIFFLLDVKKEENEDKEGRGKLTTEETRATGSVSGKVYLTFIKVKWKFWLFFFKATWEVKRYVEIGIHVS